MYYGKAIGRAKEYILGPAFLLLFCFSVLQGADRWFAAQYISSQDWRQFGGDQASHHQLASPIGPPPFKGRTVGGVPVLGMGRTGVCAGPLGMIGRTVGVVPVLWGGRKLFVRPLKGGGPCEAWWWDAWAIGRASTPGLKALLEHHEVPRFLATAIFSANLLPIYFDSIRIKIKRMVEGLSRISQPFSNTWMEGRAREPLFGN